MGMWKFKEKIPMYELAKVADEFAKDSRYSHLYIRRCSKDQLGVGFTFDLGEEVTEQKFDKYVDETTDVLRRQFGNDLCGWDVSNNIYTVDSNN